MNKFIPRSLLLSLFIATSGASNTAYAENLEAEQTVSENTISSDTITVNADIGPYIGARLGYSLFENECPSGSSQCSENQSAWGGMFGYSFSSQWALELAFTDYGDYQWVDSNADTSLSEQLSNVSLQGLYSLPLNWPIDVYVKGGAAFGESNAGGKDSSGAIKLNTEHAVNAIAGLGLEYKINDNVTIRGEYEHVFDAGGSKALYMSSHDVGLFSIGFIYHFGTKERTIVQKTIKYIDKPSIVQANSQAYIMDDSQGGTLFENGQSRLQSTTSFAELADKIKAQPYAFIKVVGHTDNVGSASSNRSLSEDRAKSVADYLVSQGLDDEKMVVVGHGEINPLASNVSEEGRAKNRRVEVIVERLGLIQ